MTAKTAALKSSSCDICKDIPDRLTVETLHSDARLPGAVDMLDVIGGISSNDTLGEVRRCSKCGTFYLYFHDHDSESGVGYGYTYESIERIGHERARQALEKNIKTYGLWLMSTGKDAKDPDQHEATRAFALKKMDEYRTERDRLKEALAEL